MKKITLITILSFFSLITFAQSASSSTRQNIVLHLRDISIVEKNQATFNQNDAQTIKIQSASQWIITTNDTRKVSKTVKQNEQKNNTLSLNNQQRNDELLYTLSKA